MSITIPAGFAHVLLGFTGSGTAFPMATTFGIVTEDSVADILTDVGDSIGTSNLPDLWHTTIVLDTIKVKKGPNTTGPSGETSVSIDGTSGTPGASPNVAMLVRKVTNLGGRQGRGRMYFPPAHEGAIGPDGGLDSGYLGGAQSILADWLDILEAGGNQMVLLHSDDDAPTIVTSLSMQSPVATQRRRQRR